VIDVETGVGDGDAETQYIASLQGVNVNIHPNPAKTNLAMKYDIEKFLPGSFAMKIYDNLGQIVFEIPIESGSGEFNVDVSSWYPGIYYYRICSGNSGAASGKFIIQ